MKPLQDRLWSLQDAKTKFSEVVKLSQEAPQIVSVRGEQKAVIISLAYFQELLNSRPSLRELLDTLPCHLPSKKGMSKKLFQG